jgi:hypothetical protein
MSTNSYPRLRMDMSGQLHASAALFPVPDGVVSENRSGRGGEAEDPCPCQESNPGRPDTNHSHNYVS